MDPELIAGPLAECNEPPDGGEEGDGGEYHLYLVNYDVDLPGMPEGVCLVRATDEAEAEEVVRRCLVDDLVTTDDGDDEGEDGLTEADVERAITIREVSRVDDDGHPGYVAGIGWSS